MRQVDANKFELKERVVHVNRTAKVVKGGRRFGFAALMVVGDGRGHVGSGLGKAKEVPEAIAKGVDAAKRNLFEVPMKGTTIPHEVLGRFGSARVMLKPAAPGTGVIAGGAVRAVITACGVPNVLTKSIGRRNPHNVVKATIVALESLRDRSAVADMRGLAIDKL